MVTSARYASVWVVALGCAGVTACAAGSEGGSSQFGSGQTTSTSSSGGSLGSGSSGAATTVPSGGSTSDPSTSPSGDSPGDDAAAGDDAGPTAATDPGDDAGSGATDASLASLGSLFPPPPAMSTSASDAMSCANLGCFDVFDCAIFHPAEFGPCGFTQCVGLVCK